MFVGEFLCCLPLLWSHFSGSSKGDPSVASLLNKIGLGKSSDEGYARVDQTEDEEAEDVEGVEMDNALTGWRMMWMWFPAFFDSQSTSPSRADGSLRNHSDECWPYPHPRFDIPDVSRGSRVVGRYLIGHLSPTPSLPLPVDVSVCRYSRCLPCWVIR